MGGWTSKSVEVVVVVAVMSGDRGKERERERERRGGERERERERASIHPSSACKERRLVTRGSKWIRQVDDISERKRGYAVDFLHISQR